MVIEYKVAKESARCQHCGGFTYKNTDIKIDDILMDDGHTVYAHTRCLPENKVALIKTVSDLDKFIHGITHDYPVMINDRGNLCQAIVAIEKDSQTGELYLEIRR